MLERGRGGQHEDFIGLGELEQPSVEHRARLRPLVAADEGDGA